VAYFNSTTNSKLTDEELIKKYRFSHDTTYLGELFLRYTPYIFGVAIKNLKSQKEAEDLTLTIFNKISSDLKRIDVSDFSKLLYRLVKDLCEIEVKKKTATGEESKMILIEELTKESNDNLYINTDKPKLSLDSNNLRLAIDTLNESQKICIDLFYIQNKSYQEVADITGYSLNQVKTNIQNGKRLLKTYIENKIN
jgi:RNA polymerase sigma-70 factor (ECF subfamily)